jgi:glycosyltransferase involved in cell wall biosynthesis
MKILLTVHQFLPDFSSGTEVLTLQTARELISRGHEVAIFTAFPASQPLDASQRFDEYTYENIQVIRFLHAHVLMGQQTNIFELEYKNLFLADYFEKLLINWQPDIVHCFHLMRLSASIVDVCKGLQIPVVITTTDFWLVCPTNQLRLPDGNLCLGPDLNSLNCLKHVVETTQSEAVKQKLNSFPDWILNLAAWSIKLNLIPQKLIRKYPRLDYAKGLLNRIDFLKARLNQFEFVIVPTKLMQQVLMRYGLISDRCMYLPYGLDLKHIQTSHNRGSDACLKIGFIGTLYEHKGVHLLIEAVHQYLPDLDLEVKIFGKTTEYPNYFQYLCDLAENDPRISFMGTFPNEKIGDVLANLDILVVPSIWHENTPLVVYSAQASGCPVIGTNVGGISEAIQDGENGLLFERGSARTLADTIQRVFADRNLLQTMSKQSKMPTTIAAYADGLEKIYSKCLIG